MSLLAEPSEAGKNLLALWSEVVSRERMDEFETLIGAFSPVIYGDFLVS
jgi:hypothetical protein